MSPSLVADKIKASQCLDCWEVCEHQFDEPPLMNGDVTTYCRLLTKNGIAYCKTDGCRALIQALADWDVLAIIYNVKEL